VGCGLGAYWAGLRRREALAFGFAMNARGSMEIVFGLLALEGGLIGERTFVALVVMALVTTWTSGPALRWLLRQRTRRGGIEVRAFVPRLSARSPRAAVQELVEALPVRAGLDRARAVELVWERERLTPTGLGAGVAVPHARVEGLTAPEVALGLSPAGLDFDAPDAAPCHLVALLLTPRGEDATHLELLSELAGLLLDARLRAHLLAAGTLTEVRAVLRTELPERGRPERPSPSAPPHST
jgi:mannitol/fructose-specific phosphotransferase system IIA component (Ntr-type)